MRSDAPIEAVLERLPDARRSGTGWTARCPSHQDVHPSLSVSVVEDGRVLLRCHAGCTSDAVVEALGLTMRDLFRQPDQGSGNRKRIAAVYDYRDAAGAPCYQVVRHEPKGFAARRPDGRGGWVWNLQGVERLLYRLPELLAADPDEPVLLPEGEKDVDRLRGLGFVATTNPGGAGKWRPEYGAPLRAHRVVVLPDNDRPGHQHARDVQQQLRGVAAGAWIVELPGLPPKGDVSDWLDAGGTADELRRLLLAARAAGDDEPTVHAAHSSTSSREERTLPFRTARAVGEEVPEQVDWFVPGYIAAGAVTELVGKIKAAGKTTWLTHAVRAIVTGTSFLDRPTLQTGVVYLTEQSPTSFRVALSRAGLLERDDVVVLFWRDTTGVAWPDVVADAVAECQRRGFGLLAVDTLPRFAGLRGDAENNAGDADAAMAPLQLAAADGLAVVVVRHERKAGGEVGDSGRGSSAFGGAVDIVLALKRGEGATRPTVRVLHALSRFDETPGELVVELQEHGYVALGDHAAVALADARGRLLADLPRSADAAISMAELVARLTGLSPSTIERARDVLMAQGDVLRRGGGRKGDPYRYWAPLPKEDGAFRSSPLGNESGQNEMHLEDDYPRSAWDPNAGDDDPQAEQGLAAPIATPDAGAAP